MAPPPATASADSRWGAVGSPVHLTVGYQTYFTESWSGVVLRAKRFYERYLPANSTVQWELGLHGPVVLAALRDGRYDIGYLGDLPAVAREIRACEDAFGASGRTLVRFSGTEPLARVMVEGPDLPRVKEFCNRIASAIERELGAV